MSPIADRSVTVVLKGDVKPFIAEMSKAAAAASRFRDTLGKPLPVNVDAASAQAKILQLERDLARLKERRDPIRPDVDTTQARDALADLQRRMSELSSRTIGVDLDAGAAKAEIAEIQRELQRLNTSSTDIDMRVDTTRALADLRTLEAQMASVSSRSGRIKVDADVGGALAGIAMVGAALAGLPAVTSIAVGVTALGGAFVAAGAGAAGFAAVAVPSLGRINEALKQQETAAGGAGGATKSAAQSAAEAASRALQLEQAERRVADAQKTVKQAQEDLTRARKDAKRANEDLAFSVRDAALAEEDAALSVEEAALRLAEVRADPESTDLQIRRAELAHRQAIARLDEQEVRTKRLRDDKAEADKKGIEGSDQVRAAQDKLLKSQADLSEAQKQLTVLQLQQKAAMQQTGGAAGGAASKMAELSKAERELAKDVKKFQDAYVAWQRSLQPDVFPVIRSGMDLMSTGMKLSTPLIRTSSRAFNDFLKALNTDLKSSEWTAFFDDLAATAPGVIDDLGDATINVAGGLRGAVEAFLPYADDMTSKVEDLTEGFERWGEGLKRSPEFEQFIAYAQENGPKVVEIVKNLAEFIGNVAEVGAGIGPGVLDFLVTLSDELAGMSPAQIQAIAEGVGLIFAAAKLGTSLKLGALVLLAQVLDDMSPEQIKAVSVAIGLVVVAVKGYQAVSGAASWFGSLGGGIDKAGQAAGGAQGKLSALGSVFGKGGLVAAVVAGSAIAIDAVGDSIQGLNPDVDKLADGLAQLGKGGGPTVELFDQLAPKVSHLGGVVENFGDSAARLTSDNPFTTLGNQVTGFIDSLDIITIDNGKQSISNLDGALATMVGNGNTNEAALAFLKLADEARLAGVPVDKLRELFPEYAQSLEGAVPKTDAMREAMGLLKVEVDPTAIAMERFNSSLDIYNAMTDSAQMTLELKDAFSEAKKAIEEAGGKLDITAQMTDKQRDAVVKARDQFVGYIEKVQAAAKAAGEMAGKTGEAAVKSDEAKEAILRQLPQLGTLAGKSSEAREQVLKLAEAYGISRADAEKAMKGAQDLQEVLDKFKNKPIYIKLGLDTDAAIASFEAFVKKVGNRSLAVALTAKQEMPARSGAIFRYAAGGLERFASGGVRSMPPHVASQPTILYGEGADDEAYIPYESRYRDRAIALLGKVANDFGLQLNNEAAARGLSDLSVTIDDSGIQISDDLTAVMGSLESTMGQAGTLTSSISKVGASADQLNASWVAGSDVIGTSLAHIGTVTADSVTTMSKGVDGLSGSVKDLAAAVAQAAVAAGSKAASTSSSGSSGGGKGQSQGSVSPPAPGSTKSSGGLVSGSYATVGSAYVSPMASSGFSSAPVNYSTVSAPVQGSSSYAPSSEPPTSAQGSSGSWGREGMANSGPAVVIQNQTINSEVDANVFAESVAMRVRGRGR